MRPVEESVVEEKAKVVRLEGKGCAIGCGTSRDGNGLEVRGGTDDGKGISVASNSEIRRTDYWEY